jgi:hypothetical protein
MLELVCVAVKRDLGSMVTIESYAYRKRPFPWLHLKNGDQMLAPLTGRPGQVEVLPAHEASEGLSQVGQGCLETYMLHYAYGATQSRCVRR